MKQSMQNSTRVTSPTFQSSARTSLLRYRRSSAVNYRGSSSHPPPPLPPHDSNYMPPPQQSSKLRASVKQNSFEKDFGVFGSVVTGAGGGPPKDEDINGLFNRRQQEYPLQDPGHRMSGGFRVGEDQEQTPQPNEGVWIGGSEAVDRGGAVSTPAHLLPSTNAPVLNTPRRRNEDLDRILAKYGSAGNRGELEQQQQQQNRIPLVRNESYRIQSCSGNNIEKYWDHHPVEVRTALRNQAEQQLHQQQQRDQVIASSRSSDKVKTKDEQQPVLRRSTHAFPFKETQGGLLVVEPSQIAFESRKVSVLVSDPNNNQEFAGRHDKILYEVKRAMSIAESNNGGGGGLKEEANRDRGKELVQKKYSDSRKATEEFERALLQKLVQGKNADTHVVIGDKVFPCHGVALEVFSSYFDRLGRQSESVQRVQLNENEVSPAAFQVLMNWLFQGEDARKGLVTKQNLVSVYTAAKHLGVRELELQCLRFVETKVEHTDADLLNIWESVKGKQGSCPELVRIVGSKLAASYADIYSSKRFLQMDVDELFMLLSNDDLNIDTEMVVYDSAVSWLLYDWKSRKTHTNKLMSCVRFGLLTPLQLTQINLCPEINKFKCEKDYNQVLAYGTVKSMIDDGLSYSILVESYKDQPEELQRWVDKTGVKSPAPRTCLGRGKLNPFIVERIMLLEDASQSKLQVVGRGSYTIVDPAHGSKNNNESGVIQEISKPKLLSNSSNQLVSEERAGCSTGPCDNNTAPTYSLK